MIHLASGKYDKRQCRKLPECVGSWVLIVENLFKCTELSVWRL